MTATTEARRSGRDGFRLWIDGQAVEGSNGTYDIINPATEQVVAPAPEASADDARRAAEAAANAFDGWSRTPVEERAAILGRAADIYQSRFAELIPLAQAETGSTIGFARTAQIPGAAHRLRRYVRGAFESREIALSPSPDTGPGPTAGSGLVGALAVRQPVGVVACITSYNVPVTNVIGKIGPALAWGNTVVIKPAPQDPLTTIALVEALHEAGMPPGVVNLVVGASPEPGKALVESPHVDMVSFTGSTQVGTQIYESAARGMKRVLMELGGKGASLVFDGADLDIAARGTATTFSFHSGQICTAPTRLIAQRKVYDEVVERLAKIGSVLKVGNPLDEDTVVGPVISGPHRDRVEGYIRSGVEEGGTIVTGGDRGGMDTGYFVAPTVIAGATNQMRAAREEIFGPVVVAIPFDDEEEGIAIANDSDYGLYSYVWSGDSAQGMRVAQRLRSGNVGINTTSRNPETPFGGFKKSGVGRDGGSFALHAYTEFQSIVWHG